MNDDEIETDSRRQGGRARKELALPADQSPQLPLSAPDQPRGTLPGLPPLSFPEQPPGEGPAPSPGGYSPDRPGGAPPAGPSPDRPGGPGPQDPQQPGGRARDGGPGQHSRRGGGGSGTRKPAAGGGQYGRPGQSGGSGLRSRRPGPVPGARPPERDAQQRALAGLVFGLLALFALLGVGYNIHRGIYLVIFAIVVGPAACWLGITALRRARGSGTARPRGAVAATVFGTLATLFALAILAAFAVFSGQLTAYNRCLAGAQTLSAQQACMASFTRSLHSGLGIGTSPR